MVQGEIIMILKRREREALKIALNTLLCLGVRRGWTCNLEIVIIYDAERLLFLLSVCLGGKGDDYALNY